MFNSKSEEMLKEMAAQQCANSVGLAGAQNGCLTSEPCRSNLRDQVDYAAHRASQEARRAERLKELQYLLDKNPETARILDLLGIGLERL